MLDNKLTGNHVAIVTPFRRVTDGRVDIERAYTHINNLLKNHQASGIIAGGLNGEGHLLSDAQSTDMLAVLTDMHNAYRGSKFIFGVMKHSRKDAIKFAETAGHYPIDALLLAPVIGENMTAEQIVSFFIDVAKATNKPIIAYNTGLSDFNFNLNTLYKIKDKLEKQFLGVKNSKENDLMDAYFEQFKESLSDEPKSSRFQYIEGNDRRIFEAIRRSQESKIYRITPSNISGASNFYPFAAQINSIYQAMSQGQIGLASVEQEILEEQLNTVLAKDCEYAVEVSGRPMKGEPVIWKAIYRMQIEGGQTRMLQPFRAMSKPDYKKLERQVRRLERVNNQQ